MNIAYTYKLFDHTRLAGTKLTREEGRIWHPYFRPWRFAEQNPTSRVRALTEPETIMVGMSSCITVLCYPFFCHESGRFIALEEFYSSYKPYIAVDVEKSSGTPTCYLYDLTDYGIYICFGEDGNLNKREVDPGRYHRLIEWMTKHIPWKVNPGLKLSSEL